MTRLAALDTSTWWGGVALLEDDGTPESIRTIAEVGLLVRETHTAHLIDLLERLLAEAGWAKDSIEAYAASRGPGSFTGIRVGLGTIRGLGLAAGRPCFGVTTLAALAEAFGPAEADRVPLLDAGRGEVYGARYDPASSPPEERAAPWVGDAGEALAGAAPVVVFGPGAERHFAEREPEPARFRVGRSPASIAAAVGRLALIGHAAGASDGDGLSPLYIRPPDAELNARRS